MKKLLLVLLMLITSQTFASVYHFDVEKCRSLLWGKSSDQETQDALNNDIQDKLNELGAVQLNQIQYGNVQSLIRGASSACIHATVWYTK